MQIAHYTKVQSLEEAYSLNQKRGAVILGGGLWLRLSPQRRISEAIDLSALGLDEIEETKTEFRLGAMVTLRKLETQRGLLAYTQGAMREAVRHIVGTQFRNMATLGGSLSGRFGFSDLLTLFLALDASVALYPSGMMKLEDFARRGPEKEILAYVFLPKHEQRAAYTSLRLNATDFPLLSCAAAATKHKVRVAIGARPGRAEVRLFAREALEGKALRETAAEIAATFTYQTNMRASAKYRRAMAAVLCCRVLANVLGGETACR